MYTADVNVLFSSYALLWMEKDVSWKITDKN